MLHYKQLIIKVYSDEEIESVLLAYINQAAALFHIPSLGQQVDIMITYLGKQRFVVCLEMLKMLRFITEIQKSEKFGCHFAEILLQNP